MVNMPPLHPHKSNKRTWNKITYPTNTPLNNFLNGKKPFSQAIFLVLLTQVMMKKISPRSLPLLIFLTNCISVTIGFHIPRQNDQTMQTQLAHSLSLIYLNYELKHKVQHSLHLLQQSTYCSLSWTINSNTTWRPHEMCTNYKRAKFFQPTNKS